MIDCIVLDCGNQFVHSSLFGRHLRRRHALDARRPVDDPGGAGGKRCGDSDSGGV